jgi:predicted dehydrogenase
VRAAARAGRRLFVGHAERFNPVVRALAKLVRGESVEAINLRRVGRTRNQADGTSVLVNLGVHDFDLAAYLGAGPIDVRGAVGLGDDLAHVLITTASGAPGHVYADRTATVKERSLVLRTARWTYEGDLFTHRLVRVARDTGATTDVPLPAEEPLAAQALAVADALDGARVREVATGADGARALMAAERAAAAMEAAGGSEDAEELSSRLPRFAAEKL